MIVPFPKEHRPHVEVRLVCDKTGAVSCYAFEFVGRDELHGPFRIDVAQRSSFEEAFADIVYWQDQGVSVELQSDVVKL